MVREIIKQNPRARIEFWTNAKYYDNVVKNTTNIGVDHQKQGSKISRRGPRVRVRTIVAGKFNRYAGWHAKDYIENWRITLRDLVARNIGGFVGFNIGFWQSTIRLADKAKRPDVIFLKGGFVGLPVGLAAKIYKIPYVIHESDATPGLANRLLMDDATVMATGFGSSDSTNKKIVNVGIPVAPEYHPISKTEQVALKKVLGFDSKKPLVMITGGSQGSENINEAVKQTLPEILKVTSVGLVSGSQHYQGMKELKGPDNFHLWDYSNVMHELMGAADVVVSRAGATTIAELAAMKKAVILVPFERLAGTHQTKNAHMLEEAQTVAVVSDEKMQKNAKLLSDAICNLIKDPKRQETLAKNLHKIARPDAATKLAEVILEVGTGK